MASVQQPSYSLVPVLWVLVPVLWVLVPVLWVYRRLRELFLILGGTCKTPQVVRSKAKIGEKAEFTRSK